MHITDERTIVNAIIGHLLQAQKTGETAIAFTDRIDIPEDEIEELRIDDALHMLLETPTWKEAK